MTDSDGSSTTHRSRHNSIHGPYNFGNDTSFDSGFPLCKVVDPSQERSTVGPIYARHLFFSGHGSAIWQRMPFHQPVRDYHFDEVGDVGIFNAEGQFQRMFNIFRNRSDPSQCPNVPDDFEPYRRPNLHSFDDYLAPGTVLSSSGMIAARKSQNPLSLDFSCNERSGAALILPEGASLESFDVTLGLLTYIAHNASQWFRCHDQDFTSAMQNVPHSVPNGTLHLVTGLICASTYSTVACHGMSEPLPDRIVSYDLGKPNPWSADFVLHWSRLHTTKEAAIFPRAVMTQGFQLALSPNLWVGRFHSTDLLGRPCYQVPRPLSPHGFRWRSLLHRRPDHEDAGRHHGITLPCSPSLFLLQALFSRNLQASIIILDDSLWLPLVRGLQINYDTMVELAESFLQLTSLKKIEGRVYLTVPCDPSTVKQSISPRRSFLRRAYGTIFLQKEETKERRRLRGSIRASIAMVPP